MADQPLTSIVGELVGVALDKPGHLRCDSLGQKRAGTAAQHLSQRVGKRAWLGKLENITVSHGVSLLQWRSGGENTPTIRRPTLSCRHQLLRIAPRSPQTHSRRRVIDGLEARWPHTRGCLAACPRRLLGVTAAVVGRLMVLPAGLPQLRKGRVRRRQLRLVPIADIPGMTNRLFMSTLSAAWSGLKTSGACCPIAIDRGDNPWCQKRAEIKLAGNGT